MARNERFHYLRMVGVEVFREKQGKRDGGAEEAQKGSAAESQEGGVIDEVKARQEEEGLRKENFDTEQNGSSDSKSNRAEEASST